MLFIPFCSTIFSTLAFYPPPHSSDLKVARWILQSQLSHSHLKQKEGGARHTQELFCYSFFFLGNQTSFQKSLAWPAVVFPWPDFGWITIVARNMRLCLPNLSCEIAMGKGIANGFLAATKHLYCRVDADIAANWFVMVLVLPTQPFHEKLMLPFQSNAPERSRYASISLCPHFLLPPSQIFNSFLCIVFLPDEVLTA